MSDPGDTQDDGTVPLRCRLFGHKMPLSGEVRQEGVLRVEEVTCKRCGEVFSRAI